jgi:hypothetical protein
MVVRVRSHSHDEFMRSMERWVRENTWDETDANTSARAKV